MRIIIYGIANCDSVKKARKWCAANNLDYQFHDFRKDGLTPDMLDRWLAAAPMDVLLNRRGTSWRQLSPADKTNDDVAHLRALMLANPTLIKRPVVEANGQITIGLGDDAQKIWAAA